MLLLVLLLNMLLWITEFDIILFNFPLRDQDYENGNISAPKRSVSFENAMQLGQKPVIDLSSVRLTPIDSEKPQASNERKSQHPSSPPPPIPRRKEWQVFCSYFILLFFKKTIWWKIICLQEMLIRAKNSTKNEITRNFSLTNCIFLNIFIFRLNIPKVILRK